MLPHFWVASTSQSAHSDEPRLESLGEEEGPLWRRVIAGQKPACIAWRGTYKFLTTMFPTTSETVSHASIASSSA